MARLLAVFAFVLVASARAALVPKQLGGPPSEFASHILPSPVEAGIEEKSAVLRASLAKNLEAPGLSTTLSLPVDSDQHFAFTIFSDALPQLTSTLVDPTGKTVDLSAHANPSQFPLSDDDAVAVPATVYLFDAPFPTGTYKLSISCQTCTSTEAQTIKVHLYNDNDVRVFSNLQSYTNSFVGQPIGLVSRITTDSHHDRLLGAPKALANAVVKAEMDLLTPDGKEIDVPMHDDGLHGDLLANDGVFGATVTATSAGTYVASAVLSGTIDGVEFVRTTQQLIAVVEPTLALTGQASAISDGTQRLTVNLGVTANTADKYRAYAEVWGVDANNQPVAVCWIGGVVTTVMDGSSAVLPLGLDLQWAAKAGAKAPFTLKNVYVQDITTFMPITQVASIPVTTTGNLLGMSSVLSRLAQKANIATEITEAMTYGVRPAHLRVRPAANRTAESIPLIAVHGYCAGGNPFRDYSQYLPNSQFFTDSSANRAHDEFATLISAYADTFGYTSFAGVGHSQGGAALLHLHQYYWSAMEATTDGRKIQSIGSPYLGCSAAGSAANLGKAFGVGCGLNYDLSVDGATLWASGLSAAAQADVYFYTTTYAQGNFFGDYCNLAMNLVLEWPNDGTAELVYTQLPHGNNMGNTQKQCHTTGMKYMVQTSDTARLQAISGARGY